MHMYVGCGAQCMEQSDISQREKKDWKNIKYNNTKKELYIYIYTK